MTQEQTEMSEVHGQEFLENFDDEFDIDSEEVAEQPSLRATTIRVISAIVENRVVWYAAGVIDVLCILYIASTFNLI